MANIADNLKRLLGTTGNNIQEILENTDSLGCDALPTIKFVERSSEYDDEDEVEWNWTIEDIAGISDPSSYTGQCLIVYYDRDEEEEIYMYGHTQGPGVYVGYLITPNPIDGQSVYVHAFIVSDGYIGHNQIILNSVPV